MYKRQATDRASCILEVVQTGRAHARATDDHGQVATKPA
jgi:hypothetical protein